jgi:iron(III) transport system ATP-binding protein
MVAYLDSGKVCHFFAELGQESIMGNPLYIENVVKRFGDFNAVDGISLEIEEGEFFTLLGPSGCGKTTLLRMIAGFNSVDAGVIRFKEKILNDIPAHRRNIGMVFQNYAIFPHMSVFNNVAYGLKARKVSKEDIEKRVTEVLDLVQM